MKVKFKVNKYSFYQEEYLIDTYKIYELDCDEDGDLLNDKQLFEMMREDGFLEDEEALYEYFRPDSWRGAYYVDKIFVMSYDDEPLILLERIWE